MNIVKIKETDIYSYSRKLIKERIDHIDIKLYSGLKEDNIQDYYIEFIKGITKYLKDMYSDNDVVFFSKSSKEKNIYSYVYWIMTSALVGYVPEEECTGQIRKILGKCQLEDGLCWDSKLVNYKYLNGDGWGARHFMPHYFIALERVGVKAQPLTYLAPYKEPQILKRLLDALDWTHPWATSNLVMNIGVSLMYERDVLKNHNAILGIKVIQEWLLKNIRSDCGMWGKGNIKSKTFKYELVRGAYHLFPLLIFDNIFFPYKERAIDLILDIQNKYGGYDFRKNSSACEDIDAIEPLIRLSLLVGDYRKEEIIEHTKRAFFWVVQNQMDDGGCVFRLGEKFDYGNVNLTSMANESNLFGTWFRTLSVCYMYDFLSGNKRNYVNISGYEYPLYNDI